MRTDNTEELAAHILQYTTAVCNANHHMRLLVLTEVKRMIDVELNRMSGLEPDRNK